MKLTVIALKQSTKWYLKSCPDEHKRSVKNCNFEKNEIAKHWWEADHNLSCDQKKVVIRESRLIHRKIKETADSLRNLNRVNKISHMLPEIWVLNLRWSLVTYKFQSKETAFLKHIKIFIFLRHVCSNQRKEFTSMVWYSFKYYFIVRFTCSLFYQMDLQSFALEQ